MVTKGYIDGLGTEKGELIRIRHNETRYRAGFYVAHNESFLVFCDDYDVRNSFSKIDAYRWNIDSINEIEKFGTPEVKVGRE